MKLILASTIACSSAQYASAKSNDAKAEKPVASQFINQQAQATQRTITGVVKDEEGMPMIGVSVVVKGTGKGTVTDMDGRYTIKVDGSRSTLTYSYVGSVPQDIVVGDKTNIDVVLKEEKTS